MLRFTPWIPAICLLLDAGPGWAQGNLAALSDPFEDGSRLKEWKRLAHEEGFPSMVKDVGHHAETGCLHLEPGTSLWLRDFRGPFLFKEVEGDFVLTTRLFLRGKRFGTPLTRWSLGGLLARQPRHITVDTWTPGHENWVSLMMGTESVIRKLAVEIRSTTDSKTDRSSIVLGKKWVWAELRMVRLGPTFLFLARPDGRPWMLVGRESRPDLPSRLQVGLAACDDWMSAMPVQDDPHAFNTEPVQGHPDVEVMFDHATFNEPSLPEGIEAADLTSPDVSDERILELFAD